MKKMISLFMVIMLGVLSFVPAFEGTAVAETTATELGLVFPPPIEDVWFIETVTATDVTQSGATIAASASYLASGIHIQVIAYMGDLNLYYWEAATPNNKIKAPALAMYGTASFHGTNTQTLTGLKADTVYNYQASVFNYVFGQIKSFKTLAAPTATPMPTALPTLTPTPTAIPTPAPTPIPVDKSVLAAKLAGARNQYNNMNSRIGIDITIQMVEAFGAKIQLAQNVYDKPDATQTEVNIAIVNLCLDCSNFGPPGSTWWLYYTSTLIKNPYGKVGGSLVRFDADQIGMDPSKDKLLVLINGVEARFTSHNGIKQYVALVDSSFSALTFAEGTPKELKYGDVNQSNTADATDMNLLKGTVAGNRSVVENFEFLTLDVTRDGLVNASDYNTFKGFIAGNITDFYVK